MMKREVVVTGMLVFVTLLIVNMFGQKLKKTNGFVFFVVMLIMCEHT